GPEPGGGHTDPDCAAGRGPAAEDLPTPEIRLQLPEEASRPRWIVTDQKLVGCGVLDRPPLRGVGWQLTRGMGVPHCSSLPCRVRAQYALSPNDQAQQRRPR